MKKVCVIGHFAFGENLANGQTLKTKSFCDGFVSAFGENEVMKIDSRGGIKTLVKAPFQCVKALKHAKNVIIFPAHNGVRVYAPLLAFLRKFHKETKIFYSVVGGWLPELIKKRKRLAKSLKKFDGIFVETEYLVSALKAEGFDNVKKVPNFRPEPPIDESEAVYPEKPYPFATFSRVTRKKGIEEAINAVKTVNAKKGETVCTLDIYGAVDDGEEEWFNKLRAEFPPFVAYKGAVNGDDAPRILKNYYALLLPTRYYTEGIPGAIEDAYLAAVPVIATAWQSATDIIDDGETGYITPFGDEAAFIEKVEYAAEHYEEFTAMKKRALAKSAEFAPDKIIATAAEEFV